METIDELHDVFRQLVSMASGVETVILADQGRPAPAGIYATYKPVPVRAYGWSRKKRELIPAIADSDPSLGHGRTCEKRRPHRWISCCPLTSSTRARIPRLCACITQTSARQSVNSFIKTLSRGDTSATAEISPDLCKLAYSHAGKLTSFCLSNTPFRTIYCVRRGSMSTLSRGNNVLLCRQYHTH